MSKSQEERVLHWLKKRGYTEVVKAYEEDQAKGGGENGAESSSARFGEANSLLFRSVQLADPTIYHKSYNELQTWICNALEAWKPELLTVSFPVFVHCYLKLIERNLPDEANTFFKTWGPDHAEHYQMELRSLSLIQRADQMQGQNFVKRALTDKFVLRLCTTSYRLLEGFLSDHNLLTIMEILNEHVKVVIEERPPRERFEVVNFLGEGSAEGTHSTGRRRPPGYRPTIRWKVPPGIGASYPNEKETLNQNLSAKMGTQPKKYLRVEEAENITAAVANPTNPTCLMATLTNTYDDLIVAKITEDATQLATGYQDRAIRIFRLMEAAKIPGAEVFSSKPSQRPEKPIVANEGGRPIVLRGHSQPVYGLSWSPDQRNLLSCAGDGSVRLWDVAFGRDLAVYRSPTNFPVWDVAFAPLGHYFVSGSYDRVARVWTTNRTTPVRLLVGHYSDVSCVCWHPNCNYVVTGSWDKTARLWDMQTGRCLRIYAGHFGHITALAISPDGQFVAGAGAGGGGGGVIRIWEISSGKEVALLTGHKNAINGLVYSPDGTVLASGGSDDTVRTWDVNGDFSALTNSITLHPQSTFRTKSCPILDVKFTKRNLLLACGPTS